MKKRILIALTAGVMALGLAGCNSADGTPEGRQKALAAAAEAGIATAGGADMYNTDLGSVNRLSYGKTLTLLTQYTAFNRAENHEYVVKIDWSYDTATYGEPGAKDFEHGVVNKWETATTVDYALFVRLNFDTEDRTFFFKGLLSVGEDTKEVTYECLLEGRTFTYTEMTHEQFYEADANQTYFVNWQYGDSLNIGKTKDYYYDCGNMITVYGKITYITPDGNFAYLENGDRVIYLWHMENDEFTGDYEMFQVGKYLKTSGYIASYYGFPQLSNLCQTEELTPEEIAAHVVEPTGGYTTVTGKKLKGTLEEGRFNQFSDYHHRAVSVICHLKSKFTTASQGSRFTVKMIASDGTEFQMAYNYHITKGRDGSYDGEGQAIINFLKGLTVDDQIMLSGRLTYADPNEQAPGSFYPGNKATASWNIVPLSSADLGRVS